MQKSKQKGQAFELSDATAVHVLYFLHRPSIVPSKTHQLGTMVPSYGPVMTFVSRVTQLLCMSFYVVFTDETQQAERAWFGSFVL